MATRLQKKIAPKAPAAPAEKRAGTPAPPAQVKRLPLPCEVLMPFRAEAEEWIREMMVEYAATDFPEMGSKWCNRIMDATSDEEAHKLVTKAKTLAHLELIALWQRHKIRGPLGPGGALAEKDAKKAEALARMLEQKGQHDQAVDQRVRAQEIRLNAKLLLDGGVV